nr:MAG TPA: hypothetical protein [Caudoviricetes sp.]
MNPDLFLGFSRHPGGRHGWVAAKVNAHAQHFFLTAGRFSDLQR